jgi:hypothetical protein
MKAIQHQSAYGNPARTLRMVEVTALRLARMPSRCGKARYGSKEYAGKGQGVIGVGRDSVGF